MIEIIGNISVIQSKIEVSLEASIDTKSTRAVHVI